MKKFFKKLAGSVFILALFGVFQGSSARAATLTVDTLADAVAADGQCSLREAIINANNDDASGGADCAAGDGADTIDITATGTILLTSLLPNITESLTVTGTGADEISISGNDSFRLFFAQAAGVDLTLNDLGLTGGGPGGNATVLEFNNSGTLTLNRCEIYGTTTAGRLVYAAGSAQMTLNRTTVRNNSSFESIFSEGTPATILYSTFSAIGSSAFQIRNNSATITGATFADNGGAAVQAVFSGTVTIRSTLFNNNGGANVQTDLGGAAFTGGYNLGDDESFGVFDAPDATDITVPPNGARLAPLGYNGGNAVQTHALMSDSPAIDQGNSFGAATDQRGLARIFDNPIISNAGDGADVGAFEVQTVTAAAVDISGRVLAGKNAGVSGATVILTDSSGAARYARTNQFGFYSFTGVAVGETVILDVRSKRYLFAPRVVNISDSEEDFDFYALQ